MKLKKLLVLLLLLGAAVVLSACGKDGEKGATGPQGAPGESGTPGHIGTNGTDGNDGFEIEFSSNSEGIVWKYTNEIEWHTGIDYASIFNAITDYQIGDVVEAYGVDMVVDPMLAVNGATEFSSFGKNFTVGENAFATIKGALDQAKVLAAVEGYEGLKILVKPGIYEEEVTVEADKVTLFGPNVNYDGINSERKSEAIITKEVKVLANEVKFDGLRFNDAAHAIVSGDHTTFDHCVFILSTMGASKAQTSRAAVITDSKPDNATAINDLKLLNSYIDVLGPNATEKRDWMVLNYVNGLEIINNYITNSEAVSYASSWCDGVRVYTAAGEINIKNNDIRYAGQNFAIMLANCAACTNINIIDNRIDGNGNLNNTTVAVRSMGASARLVIRGNKFYNITPSTLDIKSAHADSTTECTYNYFAPGFAYKFNNIPTGAHFVFDYNCVDSTIDSADQSHPNDAEHKFATLEELEAAYALVKAAEAQS